MLKDRSCCKRWRKQLAIVTCRGCVMMLGERKLLKWCQPYVAVLAALIWKSLLRKRGKPTRQRSRQKHSKTKTKFKSKAAFDVDVATLTSSSMSSSTLIIVWSACARQSSTMGEKPPEVETQMRRIDTHTGAIVNAITCRKHWQTILKTLAIGKK